ncbi:MAG: hypothetical protein P8018_04670 [Acidobacteriota bacterium]
MTHDEALIQVLAGGPGGAEALKHVERCESCRSELASLRAVEELLAADKPESSDIWRSRARRRLAPSRNAGMAAWSAAAAALAVAVFVAAWSFLYRPAPLPFPAAATSSGTQIMASAGKMSQLPLSPVDQDENVQLLQWADDMASEIPATPPAGTQQFLSTFSGDNNG